MSDSYPIPIFSGLLEPRHYDQIGNAIWLFLWCVGAVTKETERDGETWGVVLGGMPVEIDSIAAKYGVNRSTVKRWIKALQDFDYITTKRAPYGLILSVRKSKKFGLNGKSINDPSQAHDSSKMSHEGAEDGAKIAHQEVGNAPSNKDIKVFKDVVDVAEPGGIIFEIEKHFVARRGRGLHVSSADLEEMRNVVASGIPLDVICSAIDKSFAEYKKKHQHDGIRSFAFCVPRCYDEFERWKSVNAKTDAVPHVSVAPGVTPKLTKQQQELEDLRRRAEEARKLEQT